MRYYVPTVSQQFIWIDQKLTKHVAKYNIGGYSRFEGDLIYEHFNNAVKEMLRSQEAYATVFREEEDGLKCCVKDNSAEYNIEVIDLSGHLAAEAAAIEWMERDFLEPFEVQGKHLFLFKLLKVNSHTHYWYAKIHHLISDGWSFKLLLNQVADFYCAYAKGEAVPFTGYSFSAYAAENREYYASDRAAEDRQFWLNEFSELPQDLFKRIDKPRNEKTSAGSMTLYIDAAGKQFLKELGEAGKVTIFQVIITLLAVYLGRTKQERRISLGVPVLNRTKKVYRNTAGIFMNLLALQFEVDDNDTISGLFDKVKRKMSAYLRHQSYQYGSVLKDLKLLQLDKPLYHVRVSYEDFDFRQDFAGLKVQTKAFSNNEEEDPLCLYIRDYNNEGFDIRFIYQRDFFSDEMITSMGKSIRRIISSLQHEQSLHIPIHQLPMLDESEEQLLLTMAAGEKREWEYQHYLQTWHDTVSRHSSGIAITTKDTALTYADLHNRARRLANWLSGGLQLREGDRIGLYLPRTELTVTGMLGCMMAGLCYVPIDLDCPLDRAAYILKDCSCKLLLTSSGTLKKEFEELIDIKTIEEGLSSAHPEKDSSYAVTDPEAVCCILYTSGSTGTPKGVMISHSALAGYVCNFQQYFGLTAGDTVLQQASVSFDISIEEIFPILASGGRLYILENHKDFSLLVKTLHAERISILSTTPYVVNFLDAAGDFPSSLRLVISGGDVLKQEYVQNLLKGKIAVYNTYGPTECTVCATYHKVKEDDLIIPVGRPVTNKRVYILDKHLQLQPAGVEGEIFIGGKGLASGYVNNQEQTDEKFITSPFDEKEKLYRTGDIGRWNSSYEIEFLGRFDNQIKIQGVRIEPNEIEHIICSSGNVSEAAVVAKTDRHGSKSLVAYVVFSTSQPAREDELRRFLKRRLPGYMLPKYLVSMDMLPLTQNGKTDRALLAAMNDMASLFVSKEDRIEPASRLEKELAEIWANVLDGAQISMSDEFFDIGGDSIKANLVVNAVNAKLGIEIPVSEIFMHPGLREFSEVVARYEKEMYQFIELS